MGSLITIPKYFNIFITKFVCSEISKEKSLYTVLNVCFPATEKASMLLFTLDLKGIAASGGSACSSGSTKGSHVLDGIDAMQSSAGENLLIEEHNEHNKYNILKIR